MVFFSIIILLEFHYTNKYILLYQLQNNYNSFTQCNSNLDQKNPLPCRDLNPQPQWYLSNMLPTCPDWMIQYTHK